MDIKSLIKYKGIYHQIFGDLLEKIVYRKDIENEKAIIKGLGYVDVDNVFVPEVDNKQFRELSKIIFRFYETGQDGQKKDEK